MTDVLRRAKTPRPATLPAEEPHRILSTAQKYNQGKEWEEPRARYPIQVWVQLGACSTRDRIGAFIWRTPQSVMLAVLLQGLPGLVVPSAAHTKTRAHAPRCAAVVMEEWDFAAQYAQQQAAQRAARQRRLEAEEAAKTGKPKAKAGFKGGVLQDEGKPTKLQYDAAVTRSWQSSDQPDFLPQEGTPEYDKHKKPWDNILAIKNSFRVLYSMRGLLSCVARVRKCRSWEQ